MSQPAGHHVHMAPPAASIVSLCSGYGGLDLAVEAEFDARTTHVADIDRDACTVLAHRFPDAPNLGDLRAVDWSGIHADILTAGYPCQPFSHAGRRQGEHDERHIWPEVLRAIRSLRPGLVVLENVRGHLSLGFGRVLGDLAEAGFDAEWCLLRASDVGAPHGRARVFVVARPHGEPAGRQRGTDACPQGEDGGRPTLNSDRPAYGPRAATAADGDRCEGVTQQHGGQAPGLDGSPGRHVDRCGVEAVADADCARRQGRGGLPQEDGRRRPLPGGEQDWQQYAGAIARWERIIGRAAPVPLNPCNSKQLNARFVEWLMGLPDGWVTDLVPNRRALHVLGNGVVPQQAAAALRMLKVAA